MATIEHSNHHISKHEKPLSGSGNAASQGLLIVPNQAFTAEP
jgi:hypothetical protein